MMQVLRSGKYFRQFEMERQAPRRKCGIRYFRASAYRDEVRRMRLIGLNDC